MGLCVAIIVSMVMFLTLRSGHTPLNILVITLDTTRADRIGCYGYAEAETPHLDSLAQRGIVFERAYAPAPMTAPSHSSLFTGLWPPEHGVLTNGQTSLLPGIPTLAESLHRIGYDTAAFVSAFVVFRSTTMISPPPDSAVTNCTDTAMESLSSILP